ncbi:MAG: endonuclease III [Candidatus Marsarchaeota archaeon]|nr:endonuclease III [Candidatus Marsarchaeota archaeon]MCL5106318.1 endonuclease III [Candidatus Marsarchaeota archaeon]
MDAFRLLDKKEAELAVEKLYNRYPDAKYYLDFKTIDQLFVLVILSAQTRDETVNRLAPQLFSKYRTINDFAHARPSDLAGTIKSINFANSKATKIIGACKAIANDFRDKVPNSMEELTSLPGIGRKSANVILTNGFGIVAGIPVDTWVIKISRRLGLTANSNPDRIEQDLISKLPKKHWARLQNVFKEHGKKTCKAVPICSKCVACGLCKRNGVVKSL